MHRWSDVWIQSIISKLFIRIIVKFQFYAIAMRRREGGRRTP